MNNYSVKTRIPFPYLMFTILGGIHFVVTSIHDHAPSGCVSILLKGGLKLRLYDKDLNFIKETDYKAPENISFINDKKGYHSVKSIGRSSSLHFYYPKDHITKEYKKK